MNKISTLLKLLLCPRFAGGTDLVDSYERAFSRTILGQDLPALAFWKGRIALWAILHAVDLKEIDEIVLQAYTCEMVPIAAKFAGLKCRYVDVEEGCFNASVRTIAGAVTAETRAVLCQHTYGIPQEMRKLASLLAEQQITLMEDCCQLIETESILKTLVTTGATAFFSTQWNKPFSTGLGGMAVFSSHDLYNAARNSRRAFSRDDDKKRAKSLLCQVILHDLTVNRYTRNLIAHLYRWAQRSGIVQGTNTVEEYGDILPAHYLRGGINVQAVFGLAELRRWRKNVDHRRGLTRFYLQHLASLGEEIVISRTAHEDECALWAIPLLVDNKQEILRRATRSWLPIGTWFDHTPVHLDPPTAARYDYELGQCPLSERMCSCEIHLPTAPWVTIRKAKKVIQLLQKYARLCSPKS